MAKGQVKEQVTVKLSEELIQIAEQLASRRGDSFSEILRIAIRSGLASLAEIDTKFLVNQKVAKGLERLDLLPTARTLGFDNEEDLIHAIARGEVALSREVSGNVG